MARIGRPILWRGWRMAVYLRFMRAYKRRCGVSNKARAMDSSYAKMRTGSAAESKVR